MINVFNLLLVLGKNSEEDEKSENSKDTESSKSDRIAENLKPKSANGGVLSPAEAVSITDPPIKETKEHPLEKKKSKKVSHS